MSEVPISSAGPTDEASLRPLDEPAMRQAVVDMRRRRQRRRLGNHEWGELAYRVYTTTLAAIVAVVFASGLIGDDRLDASARADFLRQAPAWFGLGAAVVVLIGIRSGAQGVLWPWSDRMSTTCSWLRWIGPSSCGAPRSGC